MNPGEQYINNMSTKAGMSIEFREQTAGAPPKRYYKTGKASAKTHKTCPKACTRKAAVSAHASKMQRFFILQQPAGEKSDRPVQSLH